MGPRDHQGVYTAALRRVSVTRTATDEKKYKPIFQRDKAYTEDQALKEAAMALSALWRKHPSNT